MIDVSPTYLSLIETSRTEYPPTAERVRLMAKLLEADADEWIALAGRVPDDMEKIILSQPRAMPALLRAANKMDSKELKKLVADLVKRSTKGQVP